MLRILYTGLICLAAPLALAATAWRGLRDPAYRERLGERLGFVRMRSPSPAIWVHAASVGEVQACAPLVRALLERFPGQPVVVTTTTPTGAQRVRALFGDQVAHCYLPYDTPGAVRRFLTRIRPQAAIVLEREIWPNLYLECRRRGVPLAIASARLSPRSVRRYRHMLGLLQEALANVTVAAQTEDDAQRFLALGAPAGRVHVTGNIKFDLEVPTAVAEAGRALRAGQFPDRPVWIAASTHEGEEEIVLDAHQQVLARQPQALLILVPRHPQRFEQVRGRLLARGIDSASRSRNEPVTATTRVLLVDTLGELLMFYAAADVALVAGSLAPIGGHNLLEPAAMGVPVLIGPHNFNAPEIARTFLQRGAARQVGSAAELAAQVASLLADPLRRTAMSREGAAILAENRGAVERVLGLVGPWISRERRSDPSC